MLIIMHQFFINVQVSLCQQSWLCKNDIFYSCWITGQRLPQTTNYFPEWAAYSFINEHPLCSTVKKNIKRRCLNQGSRRPKSDCVLRNWLSVKCGPYNKTEASITEKQGRTWHREKRSVCGVKDAEADDALFLSLSVVLKKSASEEIIF